VKGRQQAKQAREHCALYDRGFKSFSITPAFLQHIELKNSFTAAPRATELDQAQATAGPNKIDEW